MNRLLMSLSLFALGLLLSQAASLAVNCSSIKNTCFTWTAGGSPYPGYCCWSGQFPDWTGGPAEPPWAKNAIPSTGQCSDLWQESFGQCVNIVCFGCCGGQKYSTNCSYVPPSQ